MFRKKQNKQNKLVIMMKYFQPILNENHTDWLNYERIDDYKEADFLLLSGGSDINPDLYGENKGKYTNSSSVRDKTEIFYYDVFIDKPKVGICRGGQLLTVLNGGKLIQHVDGHHGNHNMTTFDYKNQGMQITSDHHQMMWPWESDDPFYVIGYSLSLSSQYLNGNNEECVIKNKDEFYCITEPEIIYWPHNKSLCIQGHPEWANTSSDFVVYCKMLVDKLLEGTLDEYVLTNNFYNV